MGLACFPTIVGKNLTAPSQVFSITRKLLVQSTPGCSLSWGYSSLSSSAARIITSIRAKKPLW